MTHGSHQTYSARARRKVREIAMAVVLTLAAVTFLVAMQQRKAETVAATDDIVRAHQN